jgi:uncharacterized protein
VDITLPDVVIPRRALALALRRLSAARVLVINGPRQSGKSAILGMLRRDLGGSYLSLDSKANLRMARTDPAGFTTAFDYPMLIDEVQRGGDPLVLAVKHEIDRVQDKGRFVLAGSTRFLTEPRISESLAGRVRFVDLWPLSQGEIDGGSDSFVDRVFTDPESLLGVRLAPLSRLEVFARVTRGGFPEAVLATSDADRRDFFTDYARTVTTRDVREIADLEHAGRFRQMIRLLAARTATELNYSDIARAVDIPLATMRRYLPLFETVYIHHLLPSWSRNISAKVVQRPKVHLVDSGLAAYLTGMDAVGLNRSPSSIVGQLFETFVVGEICRQLTWSETDAVAHHWRTQEGREVDLVLETLRGDVVGLEMKAAVDVSEDDFAGLKYLRDKLGESFIAGLVVHCGDRPRRFGDRLYSVPASALWT